MFFEIFFIIWFVGGIMAWGLIDTIGENKTSFGIKLLAGFESWLAVGGIIGIALREISLRIENKKI